jgi:HlyD family secretion protein
VVSIVPQGAELILSVRIEPAEIDRVYVGQPTTIRFPSFNARITPEFAGLIRNISADALIDPQTQIRYYSAEIALIDALPPDMTLVPGMPVETFLQTAPRSPLSFLVKPFTDYLGHAMRED